MSDAVPPPGQTHWDSDESWPVVASSDLHRDGWVVALRSDRITRPEGGEPFRRLVLEHPGAAVVLAVDDEDRVLCLRQYRHPAQKRLLQLPAGLLDAEGEDPLDVARRELQEEAAYVADAWTPLVTAYSSPGISQEAVHFFLARGLSESGRGDFELEHEEADMEMLWVPADELVDAVLDGRAEDAHLGLAVLAYDALRRRDRV